MAAFVEENFCFIIHDVKLYFSFMFCGSVLCICIIDTRENKKKLDLLWWTNEGLCFKSFEFSAQLPDHSNVACVVLLYSSAQG